MAIIVLEGILVQMTRSVEHLFGGSIKLNVCS